MRLIHTRSPVTRSARRAGGDRERRRGPGVVRGPAGLLPILAAGALLLIPSPELAAQEIAITGGTVYPVSGEPIENGTVVIREGRIAEVGAEVEVPAGAERIDATGGAVTPGLMDAATNLGLVEVGAVGGTRDYSMDGEEVTAAFDVVDGLNPNSTLIPINRLGGVTTAVSAPQGGLIAGRAAVIDLAGASAGEMVVRPRVAMIASYGPGAARSGGGARGAVSLRLREVLEDALFWRENLEAFRQGRTRPLPYSRLDLEALQPVLDGEIPLVVNVDRASDIEAVLRITEEYGLRLVVQGGREAWMVADRLAAAEVPVILRPLTSLPSRFDRLGARFDNAARLHEAGVTVALSTFDTHNARALAREAGNAIRFDLAREAALEAVTLTPARLFGVAGEYGSLEPGKVANVVVWSSEDPFELSSRAETVIIRGERMPDRSRQGDLLERYRDLVGERPPAYRRPDGSADGS